MALKYRGLVLKSRTLDLATLVILLGAAQMYLPDIKDLLGDYYGVINFIIGVAIVLLRFKTTGKVGDK